VAKSFPGIENVPYVAGMNVTNLPTMTFSISSTIAETAFLGSATEVPLGTNSYTLLMWCPSMTAFQGPGGTAGIPAVDKLGGFVAYQIPDSGV